MAFGCAHGLTHFRKKFLFLALFEKAYNADDDNGDDFLIKLECPSLLVLSNSFSGILHIFW